MDPMSKRNGISLVIVCCTVLLLAFIFGAVEGQYRITVSPQLGTVYKSSTVSNTKITNLNMTDVNYVSDDGKLVLGSRWAAGTTRLEVVVWNPICGTHSLLSMLNQRGIEFTSSDNHWIHEIKNGGKIIIVSVYHDLPEPYYGEAQRFLIEIEDIGICIHGPGDFDHDGDVDQSDFGLLQAGYGSSVPSPFDLNTDGLVNPSDYLVFEKLLTNSR